MPPEVTPSRRIYVKQSGSYQFWRYDESSDGYTVGKLYLVAGEVYRVESIDWPCVAFPEGSVELGDNFIELTTSDMPFGFRTSESRSECL